jgi:hypothetical protein
MNTVPFKFSTVFGGLASGEGLLHNEGTHLSLEYQVIDGILGLLKTDVVRIHLPKAEVASLTLTECWFGRAKIVIQATNMDAFQNVPTASQGRVELSIARKDHQAAEEFVASANDNDNVPAEPSRA